MTPPTRAAGDRRLAGRRRWARSRRRRRQLRRVLGRTRRPSSCACSTPPATHEVARLPLPAPQRRRLARLPAGRRAPALVYGLRAHGPWRARHAAIASTRTSCCSTRMRARSSAVPLDGHALRRRRATAARSSTARQRARALKARVVDEPFDWGGDAPPRTPLADTVLYELHVKGFTAAATRGVPEALRGTYAGLAAPAVIDAPAAARRHRGRACCRCSTASTSERLVRARPAQLLGLQHDRLLRPEPRYAAADRRPRCATSSARWCARCTRPASR